MSRTDGFTVTKPGNRAFARVPGGPAFPAIVPTFCVVLHTNMPKAIPLRPGGDARATERFTRVNGVRYRARGLSPWQQRADGDLPSLTLL